MEAGEQCDCGLPNICKSLCCDPYTCQLRANATCATGKCCNLVECKLKTQGTNCRKAKGECDLPEFCSGQSEYCPDDLFKRNTEACGHGEYCFSGTCRSNDRRCRFLWGPTAVASKECIQYYNREDTECGILYCENVDKFQLVNDVITVTHQIITSIGPLKIITECKSSKLNLNTLENFGFAPNGELIKNIIILIC